MGEPTQRYLLRWGDTRPPDIREILHHCDFVYDPIEHGNFKDGEAFLKWLEYDHPDQYLQYTASISLKAREPKKPENP